MESEFPGNANPQFKKQTPSAPKKPEKKIEQVVTAEVSQRKKPFGRKLRDAFSLTSNRQVGHSLWESFIVPTGQQWLYDFGRMALELKIWGEVRSGPSRPGGGLLSQRQGAFDYASISMPRAMRESPRGGPNPSFSARNTFNFDEILIAERAQAQEVINHMYDVLESYGVVTVQDLYSLCGITPSITDEKFGWTDLRGSDILPTRHGYILDLPRPVAID